jgi:flavin-dependent dehydrogenase
VYDVIVVGARAAGASTAMLLARQGAQVLAVDQARFPSDTLSTHQVQVPGVACLRRWGLLGDVAASTPPTDKIRLDTAGVVLKGRFPSWDGVSTLYSPRRTVLDSLLVDAARAADAEVREGFRVDELVWADDRVIGIRGRDRGRTVVTEHASLVVGADGKHSLVAEKAFARRLRANPATTMACYSYWSGVPLDAGELYQRPDAAAAAFPTNDDLTMVYIATTIAEFPSFRADIEGNYLRTLDRFGDLGGRVRSGQRVERIRTTPDLPNHLRFPYGPGWVLVGDAGLVMDPITAQGIGNAFVDAEQLAGAIIAGLGGSAPLAWALDEYRLRCAGERQAMYEFTLALAALRPDPRMQLVVESLRGRQNEIDRFLGVFAGTEPLEDYFAARNMLRLLGVRKTARAIIASHRPENRFPHNRAEDPLDGHLYVCTQGQGGA